MMMSSSALPNIKSHDCEFTWLNYVCTNFLTSPFFVVPVWNLKHSVFRVETVNICRGYPEDRAILI